MKFNAAHRERGTNLGPQLFEVGLAERRAVLVKEPPSANDRSVALGRRAEAQRLQNAHTIGRQVDAGTDRRPRGASLYEIGGEALSAQRGAAESPAIPPPMIRIRSMSAISPPLTGSRRQRGPQRPNHCLLTPRWGWLRRAIPISKGYTRRRRNASARVEHLAADCEFVVAAIGMLTASARGGVAGNLGSAPTADLQCPLLQERSVLAQPTPSAEVRFLIVTARPRALKGQLRVDLSSSWGRPHRAAWRQKPTFVSSYSFLDCAALLPCFKRRDRRSRQSIWA